MEMKRNNEQKKNLWQYEANILIIDFLTYTRHSFIPVSLENKHGITEKKEYEQPRWCWHIQLSRMHRNLIFYREKKKIFFEAIIFCPWLHACFFDILYYFLLCPCSLCIFYGWFCKTRKKMKIFEKMFTTKWHITLTLTCVETYPLSIDIFIDVWGRLIWFSFVFFFVLHIIFSYFRPIDFCVLGFERKLT